MDRPSKNELRAQSRVEHAQQGHAAEQEAQQDLAIQRVVMKALEDNQPAATRATRNAMLLIRLMSM